VRFQLNCAGTLSRRSGWKCALDCLPHYRSGQCTLEFFAIYEQGWSGSDAKTVCITERVPDYGITLSGQAVLQFVKMNFATTALLQRELVEDRICVQSEDVLMSVHVIREVPIGVFILSSKTASVDRCVLGPRVDTAVRKRPYDYFCFVGIEFQHIVEEGLVHRGRVGTLEVVEEDDGDFCIVSAALWETGVGDAGKDGGRGFGSW